MKKAKKTAKSFVLPVRVNGGCLVDGGKDSGTDILFADALKHMIPVNIFPERSPAGLERPK